MYREGQKWRRKLIAWLKRHPEWVEEYRAEQRLNDQIRELCERRGYRFAPWEVTPWDAPDEMPESSKDLTDMYRQTLPAAVRLRRRLIAEIEAGEG